MTAGDTTRLERTLGVVLQVGSIASTVLLAIGLGLALIAPHLRATGLFLTVGLVVLMATPVARVIASVVEYASERDWTFVALTSVVLLVLTGSLLVALAH